MLVRCVMNVQSCAAYLQLHQVLQTEIGALVLCKVLTCSGLADECK